jgi:flagellar motor switch protein FliN
MVEKGKLTQDEIDALFGNSTDDTFSFKELEEDEPEQNNEQIEGTQITEQIEELMAELPIEQSVNLPLLLDIPLEVVVELGRTKKKISEVLELTSGSIVELDKMAGEPVDVYVNNKLVAKGEVVVIEEHFGVRIKEIIQAVNV